jgi:zinc protease
MRPARSLALSLLPAAGAVLLAAGALAVPAGAAEMPKKMAAPGPGPAREVRFPAFTEKTLANGLKIVVIEQREQPAISFRLVLPAGNSFDPATPTNKAGLADATAALLSKGAGGKNAQEIAAAIDGVGGSLFANAGLESASVSARFTSDQLALALDLLADLVLRPTFPAEELDRWRNQALSGLQIQQEDAAYLASTALSRLVYGEHPYGQPDGGTPASVRALTRDDLAAFHRRYYVPNGAILGVVGDVRAAEVLPEIERRFGGWAKGEAAVVPPVPTPPAGAPAGHRIVVIDKPDAVQTEIRIGQAALPFRDPDHYAAEVYNSVVGSSASGRLFEEVRRKRGLAYGAYSGFDKATGRGLFQAVTSTKTESTVEALEVSLGVLRGMQEGPVPETELTAAKTYITGAFPLEIETPEGVGDKVLEAMRFGYGKEFLETYNQKISAVTAADLQRFAKTRTNPGSTVLVLTGNAAVFSEALKAKLGDFTTIPYREVDFLQADLKKPAEVQAAVSDADRARALDLLAKARQAMGGKAFAEQRSQISRGTGTMTPPGAPQPMALQSVVLTEVFPDKSRSDVTLPMGTMVQASDGAAAWAGFGPQIQDLPAAATDERFYGLDILRRYDAAGNTARPLPDAQVAGKPAHVVEVADAQGHATRFFLDAETNRVVKVFFETGGATTETTYSDYRAVDGVQVAHRSEHAQNGTTVVSFELTEVQVNPAVDDAVFKKPAQ